MGEIFEAWCHDFGKIVKVKALDDEMNDTISVQIVESGHISIASKDNIHREWETWI